MHGWQNISLYKFLKFFVFFNSFFSATLLLNMNVFGHVRELFLDSTENPKSKDDNTRMQISLL